MMATAAIEPRRTADLSSVIAAVTLKLLPVMVVLCVLLLWEAGALFFSIPEYYSSPLSILSKMASMLKTDDLYVNAALSLKRVVVGFVLGGGTGLCVGLVAGCVFSIREMLNPLQAFLHAIPKIAIFPALAAVLGFTDEARITVIALGAFFPVYLNAISGVSGMNRRWIWVARNSGAHALRIYVSVIAPAALPRALIGIRIALNVSFVMMVATEVVGFAKGLGASVLSDYYHGLYSDMYANIVFIAILGIAANIVLRKLSSAALKGRPSWVVGKR